MNDQKKLNQEKIKKAVRDILEAVGENPDRDGLKDTPRRVAEMYTEIFSGLNKNAKEDLNKVIITPRCKCISSKCHQVWDIFIRSRSRLGKDRLCSNK